MGVKMRPGVNRIAGLAQKAEEDFAGRVTPLFSAICP
jgi:hypothetical protein